MFFRCEVRELEMRDGVMMMMMVELDNVTREHDDDACAASRALRMRWWNTGTRYVDTVYGM